MNVRIGYIFVVAIIIVIAALAPDSAMAWTWCGQPGPDYAPPNPDNCWSDGDCVGGGVCSNRQCKCGGDIEGKPICGDRCEDRGLLPAPGGATVHITDCRGIRAGDAGGVLSYCFAPLAPTPPPCSPNQGQACTSAPNICGMTSSGTIQCSGACGASAPSNGLCPAPVCTVAPATVNVGQAATATGSSGVPGYIWNLGGGTPVGGGGGWISFTYATPGSKTVTISDANGKSGACSVNVCVVNVGAACSTAPSVNGCGIPGTGTIQCNGSCSAVVPPNGSCPPPACVVVPANAKTGQLVTATGSSGIAPYAWNTGGGVPNAGAGPSISALYATQGVKTLTISDSNGKAGTCTVNIGSAFTKSGTVTTPTNLAFDTDHTIRLTVWDANGQASTPTTLVYRTKKGPWVSPSFTITPPQPAAGQPVTFTDTSNYHSSSPDGVTWDFGDGTTGSGAPTTHTYAKEQAGIIIKMRARSAIMPAGQYCDATPLTINVLKPIPGYREVRPGTQSSPSPQGRIQ